MRQRLAERGLVCIGVLFCSFGERSGQNHSDQNLLFGKQKSGVESIDTARDFQICCERGERKGVGLEKSVGEVSC